MCLDAEEPAVVGGVPEAVVRAPGHPGSQKALRAPYPKP